ncbi:MAG: hypothetical protein JW815_05570 [Candidatus Bathyarchaeota archaeon]|nr:hypothetical protein [Candidatus Bathyarchaeum sp.]
MAQKKLGVITLCAILLTLAFSEIGYAEPQGTQTVTPLNYGGLRIDITAPVQARPGDNITITVRTSASDVQQIYINYITLELYGIVNVTDRVLLTQIDHLSNVPLSIHEIHYNITMPNNLSPGLTYGDVSCNWKAVGVSFEILSSGFILTYIEDVELEQLQKDYDELFATHETILKEYNELKSQIPDNSDSTRNLMWVFIATTIVASITVFVLLLRRPKRVWV